MQVPCTGVVAEAPHGDVCDDDEHGGGERAEHQPLLAERGPQPALAQPDRDRRRGEAQRQHAELEPRERGECGKEEEEHLRAASRLGERAHARHDRRERERIGDRLGEHEPRIESVGHEERARRDRDCEPSASAGTPRKQVRGPRRKRERSRLDHLHRPEGRLDVADAPGGGGYERLEERREVRGRAADGRAVQRRKGAPEGGVQVFVGEEVRRNVQPRERDTHSDGGGHDAGRGGFHA